MGELRKGRWMLAGSMVIFSTIGLLRKQIPLSSGSIALARAVIGCVFLLLVIRVKKQPLDGKAIRENGKVLLLSGGALGFNWIALFESYRFTSVATATLCYYLAPILVILISPLVLKEKLTVRKAVCAGAALVGIGLVSGIAEARFTGLEEMKGILFGLGAAGLYACVMLLNKKLRGIGAYDKTICQLAVAGALLLPYVAATEDISAMQVTPGILGLLAVAGVVHTGVAYWLYFGAIPLLPAQTTALYSYIDPVLAVVLSMVILGEPMTAASGIGAVLILGAAFVSER